MFNKNKMKVCTMGIKSRSFKHAVNLSFPNQFQELLFMVAKDYPPWQALTEISLHLHHVLDMWQSCVEIQGYSVAYFDCITVFKAPYHWTSIKGGAHMHSVDAWIANESTKHMSPALNGSSAIQRFKGSDAIEMRDGITFDFYMGLPHMFMNVLTLEIVLETTINHLWVSRQTPLICMN